MAERVMRMLDPNRLADDDTQAITSLGREPGGTPGGVPSIVSAVLDRGRGRPLDSTTRALSEPRFGHDFSKVRIHTDAPAAQSVRAVNALAYTIGSDIVFGREQYRPGTRSGRRLLLHELAHVVQQDRQRGSSQHPVTHLQRKDETAGVRCDMPLPLRKVTRGKFEGRKNLTDYYPGSLFPGEDFKSNDMAGPFDLPIADGGPRAGGTIQIVGDLPTTCPTKSLRGLVFRQGATVTRARSAGQKLVDQTGKNLEGQSFVDFEGRQANRLGGARAAPIPQVFNSSTSMADNPSLRYGQMKMLDFRMDFMASLMGTRGSHSVPWFVEVKTDQNGKAQADIE